MRRTNLVLVARILATPPDDITISIITVEEVMTGSFAMIRKAQSRNRAIVEAYDHFHELFRKLHRFSILQYTEDSHRVYNSFPPALKRIGANDCRIAAIALATHSTLITANTSHFEKIPGLVLEDWSQP